MGHPAAPLTPGYDETGSFGRGDDRPRVGLTGAFSDPEDPKAWSGTPRQLAAALSRLGVYAGYRDAMPFRAPTRLVHWWLSRVGRSEATWMLGPEMRVLWGVSDWVKRTFSSRGADAWVAIGGVRPVRGRVATLCDISPHQFLTVAPEGAVSYWWPEATVSELAAHTRRTATVHRVAYTCCVASHWAGRSLVEHHGIDPQRVHVVGLGHRFDDGAVSNRDWSSPRFLFVGRDWHRKNGDAVVRAFVEVRRRHPLATLEVVGGHPPLAVEGITAHGELSSEDAHDQAMLRKLYGRATCFVMPSLIEPFGLAYVEAGAAGIGSVATSVGGTADSVGRGGVLVDPADVKAIADAMDDMCNPSRAAALGEKARQHASLLTWDAVAQRILRALDLTVSGLELAEFL